jgi:hypothetical protein
VTIDGKTVTDNTVAGLQNLQNLIQQYSSKNNLKLQPLYASDVVNKLKTDSNYSEVASNTIYNDGKLQLNNTQLLPMILTGATDGGKALINSDFGGNQLSNMLVNYNSFYSKAKEQGLSDQAVSLFVGNPKEFPALPDGTPNPFTNSGNQSAVGNLSSWYNSMATQANQGQANQYTRAFMSAYTPTNGNDISDSFILSLVNAKTIPAGVGASQTIKDIQNMYGTNLNAAMTQLFNQLANQ